MRTFRFALKQTIPILFSYTFVGLAFGILIHKAGYPVLWAFFAAAFIYAGSMQIVMVSLLSTGMPLYMIAIMTFFINGRHIFYGIGFIEKFRKMGWKYPFMILTLTDETYSVLCSISYPNDIDEEKVNFYIALSSYLLWIISCTIGAIIGDILKMDMKGIEFSATAFFVTVCVNQWIKFKSHIPVITGFLSSIVFYVILGPNNFLLPALSLSLIVLIIMKENVAIKMGENTYDI